MRDTKGPLFVQWPCQIFFLGFSTSGVHPDNFSCEENLTIFVISIYKVSLKPGVCFHCKDWPAQSALSGGAVEPINVLLHRTLNLVIMCFQNTLWVSVGSGVVFVIVLNLYGRLRLSQRLSSETRTLCFGSWSLPFWKFYNVVEGLLTYWSQGEEGPCDMWSYLSVVSSIKLISGVLWLLRNTMSNQRRQL